MAAAVKKILTADQFKRLEGIDVQMAGNMSVTDPDIAKAINLSDSQNTQIHDLMRKQGDANRSVMDKMRDGEIDRDAFRTSMDRNRKALDSAVAAVLTDDQRSTLKGLAGKPFKQDPQERGFGGPGGAKPARRRL